MLQFKTYFFLNPSVFKVCIHSVNSFMCPVDTTGEMLAERRKLTVVWLFGKQGLLIYILKNYLDDQ